MKRIVILFIASGASSFASIANSCAGNDVSAILFWLATCFYVAIMIGYLVEATESEALF